MRPVVEDHDAWPLAVTDPYIGRCWTISCPFCGVVGRYATHTEAERAAKAHRQRNVREKP